MNFKRRFFLIEKQLGLRQLSGTEKNVHYSIFVRKDAEMNVHILAVFDRHKTSKPYVLLMELPVSILLRTIKPDSKEAGFYLRDLEVAMIQQTAPLDLPDAKYETLNRATQCLQGLYFHRRELDLQSSKSNQILTNQPFYVLARLFRPQSRIFQVSLRVIN